MFEYKGKMEQNSLDIAHKLVTALEEKKGEDILLMDIHEVASFTDFFIICSGTSDRMIRSLADIVEEEARHATKLPVRVQGSADSGWVVVDCGDIVIHLFSPSQRDYYRLEELWEHGKVLVRLQ
jgi:ribosome-associated protein